MKNHYNKHTDDKMNEIIGNLKLIDSDERGYNLVDDDPDFIIPSLPDDATCDDISVIDDECTTENLVVVKHENTDYSVVVADNLLINDDFSVKFTSTVNITIFKYYVERIVESEKLNKSNFKFPNCLATELRDY